MNLGKSLMILVLLFSVLGVFTFANSLAVVSAQNESPGGQTWIQYNSSNVRMTALTATITVTIKITKNMSNTSRSVKYIRTTWQKIKPLNS